MINRVGGGCGEVVEEYYEASGRGSKGLSEFQVIEKERRKGKGVRTSYSPIA